MIEMNINPANLLQFVPLIATIYKVYLKTPKVVNTVYDLDVAMANIKKSPITELPVGTFDVTPDGAEFNYTLDVEDQGGSGDNVGHLQITSPTGGTFTRGRATAQEGLLKQDNASGRIDLSGGNGSAFLVGEGEGDANDIKNYTIFGVLLYRPKGQPVFSK